MNIFQLSHSVIPACGFASLDKLRELVKDTSRIEGIVGYKLGFQLALIHGLRTLVDVIRDYTDLPVIYDHQKAGTDVPKLGEGFAEVCSECDVDAAIIFPLTGDVTERAYISALLKSEVTPIVGSEMTHGRFSRLIKDSSRLKILEIAAELGVEYFVVPGNRPESVREMKSFLSTLVEAPKYCLPGIGAQGEDIREAFGILSGNQAYAIIGSGIIYERIDMKGSAKNLCREAFYRVFVC